MDTLTTSMLYALVDQLDTHYIDVRRISDNSIYKEALAVNQTILDSKQRIYDLLQAQRNTADAFCSLTDRGKSWIESWALKISEKGFLSLNQKFFKLTGLEPHSLFIPALLKESSGKQSLCFINNEKGQYVMWRDGMNIQAALDKLKIDYPSKAFWKPVKYEGANGFSLYFRN